MASFEHLEEAPSDVLRSEHRVITRVLEVLRHLVERSERGERLKVSALKRCVTFFRLYADACHHAKEEDLFFPVLEARGIPREDGPIGVMLHEHQIGRRLVGEMDEALEAVEGGDMDAKHRFHAAAYEYYELLNQHIAKEDLQLFVMGDRVMTAEDQSTLCGKFCQTSCQAFGGKNRKELERMADDLESRYWPWFKML